MCCFAGVGDMKRSVKANQHTESPILLFCFFLMCGKDTKYGNHINISQPKSECHL